MANQSEIDKEFANGPHNIKRRIVSVSAVNRADDGTYIIIGKSRLPRLMRHTKIKTNNFC